MAQVPVLLTVVGNTSPSFKMSLTRDGSPIDLTGMTVKLVIANDATRVITNPVVQGCVVTNAVGGVVTYTPAATDFPTAGIYKGDVKLSSGEIIYDQLIVDARLSN